MQYIFGNWKMHGTVQEAVALAGRIEDGLEDQFRGGHELPTVAVFPPLAALNAVNDVLGDLVLKLGAQDCHWETEGSFTGETSARILEDLAEFVFIGHPDRRAAGESDDKVARKLAAASESKLTPILCVGEREATDMESEVSDQLSKDLSLVSDLKKLIVAYEPRWALNTDQPAEAGHISEAAALIKRQAGEAIPEVGVVYGGSVNDDTAENLIDSVEGIDGLVLGTASLAEKQFLSVVDLVARKG